MCNEAAFGVKQVRLSKTVCGRKCWEKARRGEPFNFEKQIQSTLVISNSKGLYETLRDIHISTYQICVTGENN